jgi:subtilase family serine protease
LKKISLYLLTYTITNNGSDRVDDAVVSLFMNGERSAQRSIDIPAGTGITVSMEANLKETGYIEFTSELEDDEYFMITGGT